MASVHTLRTDGRLHEITVVLATVGLAPIIVMKHYEYVMTHYYE